jgi:hypothetical protein
LICLLSISRATSVKVDPIGSDVAISCWRTHREARRGAGRRDIVIDGRGLGTIRRTLIGGVAEWVIRHAHCPVFMARGDGST